MSGWRLPSPAWKTLAICTRWRAAITASSRMISGSLERGTTASWRRYAGASRPTAPAASLRPFQRSARSASSRATLTSRAPRSRQIATTRCACGQTRKVVAGALGDLAAEPHDLARAGDQLEPHDVVGRDPVLEAVRPAGVGRHVAADGRHHLARGVGSEEPPARLDRAREPEVDQPWLDRRTAVRKVDLEDPVHPVQTDHHAAERGCGAADEARARAARDDRHALTVAEVHDRHDLGRALRQGDGVGDALVEGVHVALVDEPALRRHDEAVGAEEAPELVEDAGSERHRTAYGGPVRRCARYLPRSGAARCRRARAPRSPSAPGRA